MNTPFDIARYILDKEKSITSIKLRLLIYYAQAWSLVWDNKPLFEESIEARANGPYIRSIHEYCKGKYNIESDEMLFGDSNNLSQEEKNTIDSVLEYYGKKNSHWLSMLVRLEDPWQNAIKKEKDITLTDMADYYGGIVS